MFEIEIKPNEIEINKHQIASKPHSKGFSTIRESTYIGVFRGCWNDLILKNVVIAMVWRIDRTFR